MLFGLNESGVYTPAVATKLFNESYDFIAMEQEMLAESAKAWNKIEYMVGEANCRLIHESVVNPEGVEYLMEGVIGGFFKKVKEFFIKLKNMVVEIFQKFMMWINSMIKSEKEFAEKYEKEIVAKMDALKEIDVNGFTYTHLDDEIPTIDDYKSMAITGTTDEEQKKSGEELEAKYRGKCVGKPSEAVDSEDFTDKLFEYYRDSQDTPGEMTFKTSNIRAIINELKNFSKAKSAAEKDKNKIDRDLNAIIKELDALEKKDKDEMDDKNKSEKEASIAITQIKIATVKTMTTNRNQAFTAKIAALKERAEFGKKVLLAVKSAKKENNSTVGGLFSMSI